MAPLGKPSSGHQGLVSTKVGLRNGLMKSRSGSRMLGPANVGFQEENSAPEGLERVMGVNPAGQMNLTVPLPTRPLPTDKRRSVSSNIGASILAAPCGVNTASPAAAKVNTEATRRT
jgi:hypothetical protein